jgi:fumarate hydratase class II
MTMGQEFSGYAKQIEKSIGRIRSVFKNLEETALGGTAVGTGINTDPVFGKCVIDKIAAHTGINFVTASNYFEALACRDAQVELMGALNTTAVSFIKISNDLRLLASGPRSGFGEISLPSLQPGSSIMPGKINPVIPEMVIQAGAHICGKTVSVTIGSQNGPLELNIMKPLIAYECLTSLALLSRTAYDFAEKCISGIQANTEKCEEWIKWSLALVTPLANKIGYDRAAEIAYKAYKENKSIMVTALEEKVLPEDELKNILNPENMV